MSSLIDEGRYKSEVGEEIATLEVDTVFYLTIIQGINATQPIQYRNHAEYI